MRNPAGILKAAGSYSIRMDCRSSGVLNQSLFKQFKQPVRSLTNLNIDLPEVRLNRNCSGRFNRSQGPRRRRGPRVHNRYNLTVASNICDKMPAQSAELCTRIYHWSDRRGKQMPPFSHVFPKINSDFAGHTAQGRFAFPGLPCLSLEYETMIANVHFCVGKLAVIEEKVIERFVL